MKGVKHWDGKKVSTFPWITAATETEIGGGGDA